MALLLCLLIAAGAYDLSLTATANVALLCAVVTLAMVIRVSPRRFWSASVVYLVVFCLFHFGLAAVFGLGLPISATTLANLSEWFYTPYTVDAIRFAAIGLVSCAIGSLIAMLCVAETPHRTTSYIAFESVYFNRACLIIGFALILLSVSGWFLIATRAGGVGILIGSYETFLAVVGESTLLTLTYYGIYLGTTLLAAARSSPLRRAGFAIFCAWALVALPLGLRGEVLFPGLTALVIMAKRRPPFSVKVALLLGLLLLASISALREVRQVGIQNAATTSVTASPLDALTELGSSLRPVSEAVYWKATGDQYIYGASYWAPFDRALAKIAPGGGWKLLPAEQDPLVLSSLVEMRGDGAIAFSVVAETYRNFGPTGVCVIMMLIGFLLGRMDVWPSTQVRQVLLGVLLVPFLFEIRNDFTAVPFQIAEGCAALCIVLLISRALAAVDLMNSR
ncbi:MAG: O-antigen polysaccharide polymerase Wzy family protein [Chloroflexota bacterium]|nr:O-antigen polysaccharide polymerase Wzy family protein [Chloroflexota bacterium]